MIDYLRFMQEKWKKVSSMAIEAFVAFVSKCVSSVLKELPHDYIAKENKLHLKSSQVLLI
jgi:hypothetical protein